MDIKRIFRRIGCGMPFLVISGISIAVSFFNIGDLPFDAAWAAVILCGIPIMIEAAEGLVKDRDIKAGVLVSAALIASVAIGEVFAAGEIAFIMGVGEALEERTVNKARAGIEGLVKLTPQTARVVRGGTETTVPASSVSVGDTVRVLAGEIVPADGTITHGRTSVDQSVLTGESMPTDKGEGDEVFSGTVNQFGTFDMIVTKADEDSSVQRMARLVNSADAGKTKAVRTADRWAARIVFTAIAAAGLAWIFTGDVIRAVTVLVVFCPCSLVLSAPTAIAAAIGNAAKHGILVKEGDAMERLASADHIVFDKTGTLTHGRPSVTAAAGFGVTEDVILDMAASAELRSEHPIGKAIAGYARSRSDNIREPSDFRMIPGRGVTAEADGRTVAAGNRALMEETGSVIPEDVLSASGKYTDAGCTVIYVASDKSVKGIIALSDTVRSGSAAAVKEITEMSINCTLLTGDGEAAANIAAGLTGIRSVRSNCLPEDKLTAIRDIEANGEKVCMIGDGVNDAPALKAAAVGIAMGNAGSGIAADAADMTLISDSIEKVPHIVGLSRKMMKTIRINLFFSLMLNFIAIGLAMTGILGPVTGALVHNAGSIAVVLNSAMLLGWKMRGRNGGMIRLQQKGCMYHPEFCESPT